MGSALDSKGKPALLRLDGVKIEFNSHLSCASPDGADYSATSCPALPLLDQLLKQMSAFGHGTQRCRIACMIPSL
jgi:hypothetical protein